MARDHGISNDNFRQLVLAPLNKYRGADDTVGQEIKMLDFMNNELKLDNNGHPWDWDGLLHEIGLDMPLEYATLNNLIALGGDLTYLAPEVVREFVLLGFETQASHLDLVTGSENVDQMTVTSPWIKYKDVDMVDTGQAETIAEAEIEWGKKTIEMKKSAIGIKLTDELRLSVRVPILRNFMRRVGVLLAAKLFTDGVNVLISGDQTGGTDSCAVVGVTTQTAIAFADFLRCWVRCKQIAMNWDNLVTDEAMTNTVLNLAEFKPNQGVGQAQVQLQSRNRIIPSNLPHFISSALSDNQAMLFDQAQAMTYLVFRPLLVESERLIMRQTEGTAVSIISGFNTIDRAARVIIDKSLAWAGNGFPSWMAPLV